VLQRYNGHAIQRSLCQMITGSNDHRRTAVASMVSHPS
jgi:hypothetical protein